MNPPASKQQSSIPMIKEDKREYLFDSQVSRKKSNSKDMIDDKWNNKPGVSIGKGLRPIDKPTKIITPGPTSYSNNMNIKKSQSISFPHAQKNLTLHKNPNVLGPGSYEEKTNVSKPQIPSYTMGSRDGGLFQGNKDMPGPGSYSLNEVGMKKGKSMSSFGGAKRFADRKQLSPGPSDYEKQCLDKKSLNAKGTIAEANKYPKAEAKMTPGPSDYQKISFLQNKKGITFASKSSHNATALPNLTPQAFNKYQFQQFIGKTKAYSIGKADRMPNKKYSTPSPADYRAEEYLPKRSSQATMPLADYKSKNVSDFVPGPGAYKMQNIVNSGKKFSIPRSQSTMTLSKNDTPGVGMYQTNNQQSHLKKKGFMFPKSLRNKIGGDSNVGVGQYNIEYKSNNFAGYTISHSPSGRQDTDHNSIQNSGVKKSNIY